MRYGFRLVPLVLGTLALGAPAASAQASGAAQRYRTMDANGDGVISRDEWRGSPQAFDARDVNHDGVLSRDEIRAGHTGRQERDTTGELREWTPARFRELDRNGDNRLSVEEWPASDDTFRRVDADHNGWLSFDEFLGFETAPPQANHRRFDELDRNRDGRVTIEEWGTDAQGFQALDRDRSGLLSRDEVDGADDAPADLFGSLDANRDGRVTRDEWRWSAGAFDRRDTDRDGVLSRRELASASPEVTPRSAAYRAGSERGLADGRKAGREDKQLRNRWDLDGQRELEQADAGYTPATGDRSEYQAGYRDAFRRGYAEGFGPR